MNCSAVVADDSTLLRTGISKILVDAGIRVLGQAGDGLSCCSWLPGVHPTSRSSTSTCLPTSAPRG